MTNKIEQEAFSVKKVLSERIRKSFYEYVIKRWYVFVVSFFIFGLIGFVLKKKLPDALQQYYFSVRTNLDQGVNVEGSDVYINYANNAPLWTRTSIFTPKLLQVYFNSTSVLEEALLKSNGLVRYSSVGFFKKDLYGKVPYEVIFWDCPQNSSCSMKLVEEQGFLTASNFTKDGIALKSESESLKYGEYTETPLGRIFVKQSAVSKPYKGNVIVSHMPLKSLSIPMDAFVEVYEAQDAVNFGFQSNESPIYVKKLLNSIISVVSSKLVNDARDKLSQSIKTAQNIADTTSSAEIKNRMIDVKNRLLIDYDGIDEHSALKVVDSPRRAAKVADVKAYIYFILMIFAFGIPLLYFYWKLLYKKKVMAPEEVADLMHASLAGKFLSSDVKTNELLIERSAIMMRERIASSNIKTILCAPICKEKSDILVRFTEALNERGVKNRLVEAGDLSQDKIKALRKEVEASDEILLLHFSSPLQDNNMFNSIDTCEMLLWTTRIYKDSLVQVAEIAQIFEDYKGLQSVLATL